MAKGIVLVYPTYGHLAPTLGVAAELVRRGEKVVFYGTGRSRQRIESTGARFRLYQHGHDEFNPTPPTEGLFSDMARLAALTENMLPAMLEEVRTEAPDYLLIDTKSLWGRLLAQVLKVPAVTLSVVFAIQPGLISVSDLVQSLYGGAPIEALAGGLTAFSGYFETARRLQRRYGTICPGIIEYLGNPQPLNIIFTSREFQLQGEAFGEEFKFVGPSLPPGREQGQSFPWHECGSGPLVYVSLGTTFNHAPGFYRTCFEAFAGTPWQIVLSTGGADPAALGTPPPNVLVKAFVPQLAMLQKADVFITHGGMNSANEGLAAGVPLMVVPQRGDQHLVAARVTQLGAGLGIHPREITAERLRTAVDRILHEDGFRVRARALADSMARAGGFQRAAGEILSFVAGARAGGCR